MCHECRSGAVRPCPGPPTSRARSASRWDQIDARNALSGACSTNGLSGITQLRAKGARPEISTGRGRREHALSPVRLVLPRSGFRQGSGHRGGCDCSCSLWWAVACASPLTVAAENQVTSAIGIRTVVQYAALQFQIRPCALFAALTRNASVLPSIERVW